ncbi:MAG TPA: DUF3995 domain-containing protein [Ktedonobacteraceae bacterium]
MNEQMKEIAGILVAVVLIIDGLFHAYWATGQTWPARDRYTLAQVVLNVSNGRSFRPSVLLPLVVLLFGGALVALARVHRLGLPGQLIPGQLLQLGILAIAAGLLLRGLAGIVWILWRASAKSRLFYQLNLVFYTPVCFILFVAAVAAALS